MTSKATGNENYTEPKRRRRRRRRTPKPPTPSTSTSMYGVPAGITEEDRVKIAHRLINFARLLTTKENFERHVAELSEGAKPDSAIAKLIEADERGSADEHRRRK